MGSNFTQSLIKKPLPLACVGLSLAGCASAMQSQQQPLQTMLCAGEHKISFYDQREFDKACIDYIESKRNATLAE